MRVPEPVFAPDLKRCADIVAIAASFTKLRRAGSQWLGLCPLPDHRERHASFYVHPRGVWFCFGCSRGGDVFRFVMAARGCSFPEALRFVAEFAPISARPAEPAEPGRLRRPAPIARQREREPKATDALRESREPLPPCFFDSAAAGVRGEAPALLENPNNCAVRAHG